MIFSKLFHYFQHDASDEDQHTAGTGFMQTLTDAVRDLKKEGYNEHLIPCFDHLTCRSGTVRMYPRDFYIDEMIRFENSSDPADQSILYAISCKSRKLKGLYVESYGTYHDELSGAMLERIKQCRLKSHSNQSQDNRIRLAGAENFFSA